MLFCIYSNIHFSDSKVTPVLKKIKLFFGYFGERVFYRRSFALGMERSIDFTGVMRVLTRFVDEKVPYIIEIIS